MPEWLTESGMWVTGVLAAVSTVSGLILAWRKFRIDAETAAVAAAKTALESVETSRAASEETMQMRITVSDQKAQDARERAERLEKRADAEAERTAGLERRLTETERVRIVAVEHIADRETFAVSYWEQRPDGLPKIPALIATEVLAAAPHLRLAQNMHGGDGPDDSDEDEEDSEDE